MPSRPSTLNGISSKSLPGAHDRQFPSLSHRLISYSSRMTVGGDPWCACQPPVNRP